MLDKRGKKRFIASGLKRSRGGASAERARVRRRPLQLATELEGLRPGGSDRFAARDFSRLLGMRGFSDRLLRNHFELYQGYVENANAILDELEAHAEKGDDLRTAELKRRFGWEYDSIRLHELYFDNLSKEPAPLDPSSGFHERLRREFGHTDKWAKDFRATGAMRGIGWVVLYHDTLRDRLFNAWIEQHHTGHLVGCAPVLVMDVFEHAYTLDYGVRKADYIEAFFAGIHWDAVVRRLP